MATEIERAAQMLEADGYLTAWTRVDHTEGLVAFLDPHTLKATWTGPRLFGIARFSARELRDLRGDPNCRTQIYHRVQEAKQQLLDDIQEYESEERVALISHAVKLSSILCATVLLSQFF